MSGFTFLITKEGAAVFSILKHDHACADKLESNFQQSMIVLNILAVTAYEQVLKSVVLFIAIDMMYFAPKLPDDLFSVCFRDNIQMFAHIICSVREWMPRSV